MSLRRMLAVFLLVFLAPALPVSAAPQEVHRPLTFGGPQFVIEDLSADTHSDGNILVVSGKVKNLAFTEVRGYVTVFFKNAHHEVLKAVDLDINDRQPLATNQACFFETSTQLGSIQGLANVSVEFTETGRGGY